MKSSNDKMISDENCVKEFYSFSVFALKTFGEVLCFTEDQYEVFKEFVIRFHEKWREKKDEELISGAEKRASTERAFDFDELENMFEEHRWKEKR